MLLATRDSLSRSAFAETFDDGGAARSGQQAIEIQTRRRHPVVNFREVGMEFVILRHPLAFTQYGSDRICGAFLSRDFYRRYILVT